MLSKSNLPSNKNFGFLFSFIFIILIVYFTIKKFVILALLFSLLSLVFLILSIKKPDILEPLNQAWMHLGRLLGVIVSPLIVGFIFFVIISPVSILTNLFGRDELKIKKKTIPSLWNIRNKTKSIPSLFKNQF